MANSTPHLVVLAPVENSIVTAGHPFAVTGRVTSQWPAPGEPTFFDSVTVEVDGEPPIEATLTNTPGKNVTLATFTASAQVSGFLSPESVEVTVVVRNDMGLTATSVVPLVCLVEHNQRYVSTTGKKTNAGGPDSPWCLAYAAAGADQGVQPGDTVWVQGGTYGSETGYTFSVSGNATGRITFRPYPGERVVIDGAIDRFTTVGNMAWQLEDPHSQRHKVYRSVDPVPASGSPLYGGFIQLNDEWYTLAPHKSPAYLRSDKHDGANVDKTPIPRYLGPGVSQEAGYVYVRLDNSDHEAQLDRQVPQISDPDPRHHQLFLFNSNNFGLTITGSHLVIDGFEINNFNGCFVMGHNGPIDITVSNCSGRPGRFGGRCGPVDGLVLRSCTFRAHMPSDRWWVAYSDIHGPELPGTEPPGEYAKKLGLDLGLAQHVEIVDCVFDEFFDGLVGDGPHHVEVHDTTFLHIWDDAWQMYGNLYHVNFHHNICYGPGPSMDHTAANAPNAAPGTIYIHHNIIDTRTRLLFWARKNHKEAGVHEPIPMSAHGWPPDFTIPRKLYYNTVVTETAGGSNVGWALFGANTAINEALHEVYNNIFVSLGRPGGRDFYANSGREIYDGNVYWSYVSPHSPWTVLHVSDNDPHKRELKDVITVQQLRESHALADSMAYYPPGWESTGLSEDPHLDGAYRPHACSCKTGAINLKCRRWPGTDKYEPWRGAVEPPPGT